MDNIWGADSAPKNNKESWYQHMSYFILFLYIASFVFYHFVSNYFHVRDAQDDFPAF